MPVWQSRVYQVWLKTPCRTVFSQWTQRKPRQSQHFKRGVTSAPVEEDRLNFLLNGYNASLLLYLVNGFTFGFGVGFVRERGASQSPNLKSALEQPQVVHPKLRKECEAGRIIIGPFLGAPFPKFVCSPLVIVPKKNPQEFRLMQHLSYPKGTSVNDFIPDTNSSVRYASISDAIGVIIRGWLLYGQNGY